MYIKDFQDLIVWQKAHQFVKKIYKESEINLPAEEKYGIESQLKRAVVSVPANIAEGCRRRHTKELIHFLNIALGSLSEVRYYLLLCKDFNYISDETTLTHLSGEVIKIEKQKTHIYRHHFFSPGHFCLLAL